MSLCGNYVEWCETIKYLGVYLQGGSSVRFDVSPAKRALYIHLYSPKTVGIFELYSYTKINNMFK